MYKWTTLRALAGLMLCLPLVHFVYIVSNGMSTYLNPSPMVWNPEIAAIVERDLSAVVPEKPIVVIGGQRVRLWNELPASLLPRPTLMRPLGDATLEDLAFHYDRLVAFYRPEILVVFPGYADLYLRDQKGPEDFKLRLRELLKLDEDYGASNWRYVIAPIQMPLHTEDSDRIRAIVEQIRFLGEELPDLTIIDPNPILAGSDGLPNPAFYRGDGVNLNPNGYARLSLMLEWEIEKRDIQGYVIQNSL